MKKQKLPLPVTVKFRPVTKGLNYSKPAQTIGNQESPANMNIRFRRGQVTTRQGFKMKYINSKESLFWIDTVYSAGFTNVVAFGAKGMYYVAANKILRLMQVYDGLGNSVAYPMLSMGLQSGAYISIDVGEAAYYFVKDGVASALFPNTGYDGVMLFTNGTTGGIYAIAYTGDVIPVIAERMSNLTGFSYGSARCVAVFDGRAVVGGVDTGHSAVAWSSKGRFDHWDPAVYTDTGFQLVGDSPDWVQRFQKLGDYLIVYKERSIWIGRRSYLADPALVFDPAPGQGIGMAAPNSLGDLGDEHIFLGWDDVYMFSLSRLDSIGSRIKSELFYGANGVIPKYVGSCFGTIAEEFDEYWLFVPSGKWPENTDGTSIDNMVSNPVFFDGLTNWTLVADGDGTLVATTGAGLFSDTAAELTFTTGTYAGAQGAIFTYATVQAVTNEVNAIAWVKPTVACTVRLSITVTDAAGANPVTFTKDFTLTAATWQKLVFSTALTGSVAPQIIHLETWLMTAGVTLSVTAAHLVDTTLVPTSYIVSLGTDYQEVGYIDANGTPSPIPFIIDSIGQWMPDTCWVYNYVEDSWSSWRIPMAGFGYDSLQNITTIGELTGNVSAQTWRYDEKLLTQFSPSNLLSQVDGQIYEFTIQYQKDFEDLLDTPVMCYWESKDIDLDRPDLDKTFGRLTIYHNTNHPAISLTVSISTDGGVTNWQDQTVTIRNGWTNTFVDFQITAPQARFRIKSVSTPFYITGFDLKLVARGETHAY